MKRNVLIVNASSIYSNNATGITLRSVFQKLDSKKCLEVAWIGVEKGAHNKIRTIVPHYGKLSVANVLLKGRRSGINKAIKSNALMPQKRSAKKKLLSDIRQYLALIPNQCKLYFTTEDMSTIEAFSPDVIYTLGASVNVLQMVDMLSRRFQIPVVVHHMDNWLHCLQWEDNILLSGYKRKLRNYCRRCYERTTKCIAISNGMAEDFTKETGVEHVAIMNSINCTEMVCGKLDHPVFRFLYAGGMHLERYKALLDFADEVEKYRRANGKEVEFSIYTGQDNIDAFGHFFEGFTSTTLHPAVSHDQIKGIYESADALIHVESMSMLNSDFSKYSISTKIPEYLSTGKPVVFYGPDMLYLFHFLKKNEIALVAKEKQELASIITTLVEQLQITEAMTERAKEYAKVHFEICNAVKMMQEVLDQVQLPDEA